MKMDTIFQELKKYLLNKIPEFVESWKDPDMDFNCFDDCGREDILSAAGEFLSNKNLDSDSETFFLDHSDKIYNEYLEFIDILQKKIKEECLK